MAIRRRTSAGSSRRLRSVAVMAASSSGLRIPSPPRRRSRAGPWSPRGPRGCPAPWLRPRGCRSPRERGEDQGRRLGVGGAEHPALTITGHADHGPTAHRRDRFRSGRASSSAPVPSKTRPARRPSPRARPRRRESAEAGSSVPGNSRRKGGREPVRAAPGRPAPPRATCGTARAKNRSSAPLGTWAPAPRTRGNASKKFWVLKWRRRGSGRPCGRRWQGPRGSWRAGRRKCSKTSWLVTARRGPYRAAVEYSAGQYTQSAGPIQSSGGQGLIRHHRKRSRVRIGSSRRGKSPSDDQ